MIQKKKKYYKNLKWIILNIIKIILLHNRVKTIIKINLNHQNLIASRLELPFYLKSNQIVKKKNKFKIILNYLKWTLSKKKKYYKNLKLIALNYLKRSTEPFLIICIININLNLLCMNIKTFFSKKILNL